MERDRELTDRQIREKLIARGAASLTDAELLSILLREGSGGATAIGMAEALLARFRGSLTHMGGSDLQELRTAAGLGVARAATVAAALELGHRLQAAESLQCDTIHTDRDVVGIFRPLIAGLLHEEFWAVYVNSSNRILDRVRISQGGVSATVVDHRIVVKRAVEKLAHGIVLVHNHPSGSELPSDEDRTITARLSLAASLFDIELLDHVIVTAGRSYSFRNEGFFDEPEEDA